MTDTDSVENETASENAANNRAQRSTVRKQMWLVLAGLFLAAVCYTGWQWCQGEYVVGGQPVPWRKAQWKTVEQELERGRRMAIFVSAPNDEQANEDFLAQFENERIRKQLFYTQRLPLKLQLPDDQQVRAEIHKTLSVESTPCCIITKAKGESAILIGQVTADEIAAKIAN